MSHDAQSQVWRASGARMSIKLGDGPKIALTGLAGLKLGGINLSLTKPAEPAEQVPDPLAHVEYTGVEEIDTKAELNALQIGFRERKAREAERFKNATDSEFWVALCFRTREQKEQFLKVAKLIEHGDKYLDGELVAKILNIPLE